MALELSAELLEGVLMVDDDVSRPQGRLVVHQDVLRRETPQEGYQLFNVVFLLKSLAHAQCFVSCLKLIYFLFTSTLISPRWSARGSSRHFGSYFSVGVVFVHLRLW
jgi:hypothetical protein